MSDFVMIPNAVATLLTSRSKHNEVIVYAAIRNEIKDSARTASYAQSALAEMMKVDERTMQKYVAALKDAGLFSKVERKMGNGSEHPYNVYTFPMLKSDYFFLLPSLLEDEQLTPKEKGILLFIKANCWSGTNYMEFHGRTTDLAQKLGIGKNQIKKHMDVLERKQCIRFIGNTLHLLHPAFPLFIDRKEVCNLIYEAIYEHCLSHDRVPPYKCVNQRNIDPSLSILAAHYPPELIPQLKHDLQERCHQLPSTFSLNYFCQALRNKMTENEKDSDISLYMT